MGLFCGLIDPDVIDDHGGGEAVIVDSFLSAPAAAYGDVQQQMKPLIERPFGKAFTGIMEGGIDVSIYEEADLLGVPFDGVSMEGGVGVLYKEPFCLLCMD